MPFTPVTGARFLAAPGASARAIVDALAAALENDLPRPGLLVGARELLPARRGGGARRRAAGSGGSATSTTGRTPGFAHVRRLPGEPPQQAPEPGPARAPRARRSRGSRSRPSPATTSPTALCRACSTLYRADDRAAALGPAVPERAASSTLSRERFRRAPLPRRRAPGRRGDRRDVQRREGRHALRPLLGRRERDVRHLHFNVCYYAAIEHCIARGLRRFEPGAGGEFKQLRGFEATPPRACTSSSTRASRRRSRTSSAASAAPSRARCAGSASRARCGGIGTTGTTTREARVRVRGRGAGRRGPRSASVRLRGRDTQDRREVRSLTGAARGSAPPRAPYATWDAPRASSAEPPVRTPHARSAGAGGAVVAPGSAPERAARSPVRRWAAPDPKRRRARAGDGRANVARATRSRPAPRAFSGAYVKTSPSGPTSISTRPPSLSWPKSISSARTRLISCWMRRAIGRAPKVGVVAALGEPAARGGRQLDRHPAGRELRLELGHELVDDALDRLGGERARTARRRRGGCGTRG